MQALSLCQKFDASAISYPVGVKIGEGADGEVYQITNDSTKVIKFGVFYEREKSFDILGMQSMFQYLMDNSTQELAQVFNYKYVGESIRDVYRGQQKYFLYYYVMEKLNRISDDESKVFHTILSHEDRNITKNYTNQELTDILNGLSYGLDFNSEKITEFHFSLDSCPIHHSDIHSRNIMKDAVGNFKLIDFDRSFLK